MYLVLSSSHTWKDGFRVLVMNLFSFVEFHFLFRLFIFLCLSLFIVKVITIKSIVITIFFKKKYAIFYSHDQNIDSIWVFNLLVISEIYYFALFYRTNWKEKSKNFWKNKIRIKIVFWMSFLLFYTNLYAQCFYRHIICARVNKKRGPCFLNWNRKTIYSSFNPIQNYS